MRMAVQRVCNTNASPRAFRVRGLQNTGRIVGRWTEATTIRGPVSAAQLAVRWARLRQALAGCAGFRAGLSREVLFESFDEAIEEATLPAVQEPRDPAATAARRPLEPVGNPVRLFSDNLPGSS